MATVKEVRAQFEVVPKAQIFTVVASNGKAGAPAASLVNGLMVWFASFTPDETFGVAVGAGGAPTVGV